jgi:hypothetical protein
VPEIDGIERCASGIEDLTGPAREVTVRAQHDHLVASLDLSLDAVFEKRGFAKTAAAEDRRVWWGGVREDRHNALRRDDTVRWPAFANACRRAEQATSDIDRQVEAHASRTMSPQPRRVARGPGQFTGHRSRHGGQAPAVTAHRHRARERRFVDALQVHP